MNLMYRFSDYVILFIVYKNVAQLVQYGEAVGAYFNNCEIIAQKVSSLHSARYLQQLLPVLFAFVLRQIFN